MEVGIVKAVSNVERVQYIERQVKAALQKHDVKKYPVSWKNNKEYLPIISVPVGYLLFNLKNGRTIRLQQEVLEEWHLDSDTFSDVESPKAQSLQEEILVKLAKEKGLQDSILNEKQQEPAIITTDGVVINGNRRLAILRRNGADYIDCVVLPNDGLKEPLYDLEVNLQMSQDTKMPYNWLDELLQIQRGMIDFDKKPKDIAKIMRLKKGDVEERISTLKLVDEYLRWSSQSGKYYKIVQDRQAFDELLKQSKRFKNDPEKFRAFREKAFLIISTGSEDLDDSKYRLIKKLANKFSIVQEKLVNSPCSPKQESLLDGSDEANNVKSKKVESPSTFVQLAGTSAPIEVINPISHQFSSLDSAEDHKDRLLDAIQEADAEDKEEKNRRSGLDSIIKAHCALEGLSIDLSVLKGNEIAQLKIRLENIVTISNRILGEIRVAEK